MKTQAEQPVGKTAAWLSLSNRAIMVLSAAGIGLLYFYSVYFWDDPRRVALLFTSLAIIVWTLGAIGERKILPLSVRWNLLAAAVITVVAIVIATYFYSEFPKLIYERAGNNSTIDFVMGATVLFLVIALTWRMMGPAIPITAIVALIYAYFGPLFPGFLNHPGLSLQRILQMSAVEMQGIYGSLNATSVTLVLIFLFYGGFILGFGGLDYIIHITSRMLGKWKYGLAQVPVISSMMFGSFSGSAAANVAGTGSFTIPMMKRFGIKGETAGAIESVASSGGQVMPPVMGISAFLMAEFLGVHYIEIVMMGFAPALIFYICTGFAVFLRTKSSIDAVDRKKFSEDMASKPALEFDPVEGWPIIISLALLLLTLIFYRISVLTAGFYSIFTFLGLRAIYEFAYRRRHGSSVVSVGRKFGGNMLKGLVDGTQTMSGLMVMLGCMGIVDRVLVVTGLAQKLAFGMFDLAGGNLYFLLLLVMVVCTLFGMAISTVVSYMLVVMLAVPALQIFGIEPVVTHFVVFYIAVLAGITPPVAVACAVGASIAKASYTKTCNESMLIGAVFFIMPFSFIWYPDILKHNLGTLGAGALILVGALNVAYALNSKSGGVSSWVKRILHGAFGMVVLFPTYYWVNILAISGIAILVGLRPFWKRLTHASTGASQ